MADALRLLRRLRQRNNLALNRTFRDRLDPLNLYDDDELYQRFRFRRPTIIYITNLVADRIRHETNRSFSLLPLVQVLIFLRFVATGGFYQLIGDSLHVSKATAGRCVRIIADILSSMAGYFITFPTGEAALDVKRALHAIAGFPDVVGLIDGTQVKISKPHENEPDFVNRKGFHSINIQMTCDNKFKITNCVAKWPGSCHDSRIFRESGLCQDFVNGTHSGILLGDSGYPCKRYLMTPYLNTEGTRYKEKYNRGHCRTRVLIEQTFGILKRRFTCLATGIRTDPNRACKFIVCCAVLHNIGILRHDIVNIEEEVNADYDNIHGLDVDNNVAADQNGNPLRDHIAQTFFG